MSFETLYRQLFADLHRYAFTILNDAEWATDVVQDGFLKYYHQLKNGSAIEHDKAYLYRIVYNTAVSQLRKRAVEQKHQVLAAADQNMQNNVEDERVAAEQRAQMQIMVHKIIDELPEQCRNVFLKSRTEGKKYREIAEELSISVKTVEAHMSKALKIIQEFIRVNKAQLSLIQIVWLYELFC